MWDLFANHFCLSNRNSRIGVPPIKQIFENATREQHHNQYSFQSIAVQIFVEQTVQYQNQASKVSIHHCQQLGMQTNIQHSTKGIRQYFVQTKSHNKEHVKLSSKHTRLILDQAHIHLYSTLNLQLKFILVIKKAFSS